MTRIVHTADWHLGARLIDCERHDEHRAFLDWFLATLGELKPDLLIVAGDIFDGATPPQEALKLYYEFLGRLGRTVDCQTLILGGNHDSPATLHAPRDVLRALDVRVIASPPDDPLDAIFEFEDAVVCAVPFLRERDVRTAAPGQTADDVAAAIRTGIARHYDRVAALARSRAGPRPIIGTGHLTALGCQVSPSERAIHIGNLGAVDAGCFGAFAYTALGHIHRPQAVGGNEGVRYAGAPLPLSFSEAGGEKEIRVIDLAGGQLTHRAIAIPTFRPLRRVVTDVATLPEALARAQGGAMQPWIELTVSDGHAHPDLARQVRELTAELNLRVLKLLVPAPVPEDAAGRATPSSRSLDELRPEEVFQVRLRRESIDPASAEGAALVLTFAELLGAMPVGKPVETTAAP